MSSLDLSHPSFTDPSEEDGRHGGQHAEFPELAEQFARPGRDELYLDIDDPCDEELESIPGISWAV